MSTSWKFICAILLIFGASSCTEKSKQPSKKEETKEFAQKPKGIISLNEAKVLCDNYESRRLASIIKFEESQTESEEKFVPTQFVNFELKTIKAYIKYVEKEAKKANVKPDSLRIYLGNYGKKGKSPNKNTVFILPTAKVNGNHGGFFINSKGKAELIREYWPKGVLKSKASILPFSNTTLYQSEHSLILNNGEDGPPPSTDFN